MNALDKKRIGFWKSYLGDTRSLAILVVVCSLIAFITNALNNSGYGWNLLFSFCYGLPISMIETYLRVRRNPLPETAINLLSVIIGSVIGTSVIYAYLVRSGIVEVGELNGLLVLNFGFGFAISAVAFYFFWSRYRNQTLTLALRDQQLKAAELENLKQQAENRLLQSQMEPHFLFNTLANIQSLIDMDAAMAKSMVNDLSQMLRASLKNSSQDVCSLAQEMALVRAYLNIQTVRIGDRLSVVEAIEESALEVSILPMIIQPLVENSIRHGVEKTIGSSTIRLGIKTVAGKLEISVEDNCPDSKTSSPGHGLSLSNIRKRMANTYGDQSVLVSERTPQGWRTTIFIPLMTQRQKKQNEGVA